MGKSLGNILEPRKLLAAYGSDAVRFYFLKEVVFGQACLFSLCRVPLIIPESVTERLSNHASVRNRTCILYETEGLRGCPSGFSRLISGKLASC